MHRDGIDFDALIEMNDRISAIRYYAVSNDGPVFVDVKRLNGEPSTFILVPQGMTFKEKIFGVHTNPEKSYPTVKKMHIACNKIRHFKTYPNQFPNLEELRFTTKVPSPKEIDMAIIDILSNNTSLIDKPLKIIVDHSKKFYEAKDYASFIKKNAEKPKEEAKNKENKQQGIQYLKTVGSSLNCYRLEEKLNIDKLEVNVKDMPQTTSRKKVPDYGFVLTKECEDIKEMVLGEGLTTFDISDNVDFNKFKLERITFPSTISLTNILLRLNLFKKLMFVFIKPSKRIQVKFSNLHYIIANLKKKQSADLFFTYNGDCTYGGITYISHFKEEKLEHFQDGYYYLVEGDEGEGYCLFKTDFVDDFKMVKEIKGKPVKYVSHYAFSNCKKHPAMKYTFKSMDYYLNKEVELIDVYDFASANGLSVFDF